MGGVTGDDENLDGIAQATTSETDLCNDALGQIGSDPIVSLSDGSVKARRCLVFYPQLRDGLLRGYKWNFALTRVQLAQQTGPLFDYAYRYALPADCLRVWEYNGAGVTVSGTPISYSDYPTSRYLPLYKIEGRSLLSNDSQAYIVYGRRVLNPAEWDPLFYQVVATWLAGKLASAIPKMDSKAAQLIQYASTTLLSLALAADGQEGSSEPIQQDTLTWGR